MIKTERSRLGTCIERIALSVGALIFGFIFPGIVAAQEPNRTLDLPECPAHIQGYWTLDENNGRFVDTVGTATGECVGNCPSVTPGLIDNGQQFDGATTGINFPTNQPFTLDYYSSFYLAFWMKAYLGSTCYKGPN